MSQPPFEDFQKKRRIKIPDMILLAGCGIIILSIIFDYQKIKDAGSFEICYQRRATLEAEILKALQGKNKSIQSKRLIYILNTPNVDDWTRVIYLEDDIEKDKNGRIYGQIIIVDNQKVLDAQFCPRNSLIHKYKKIGYIMSRGRWLCMERRFHNNKFAVEEE